MPLVHSTTQSERSVAATGRRIRSGRARPDGQSTAEHRWKHHCHQVLGSFEDPRPGQEHADAVDAAGRGDPGSGVRRGSVGGVGGGGRREGPGGKRLCVGHGRLGGGGRGRAGCRTHVQNGQGRRRRTRHLVLCGTAQIHGRQARCLRRLASLSPRLLRVQQVLHCPPSMPVPGS